MNSSENSQSLVSNSNQNQMKQHESFDRCLNPCSLEKGMFCICSPSRVRPDWRWLLQNLPFKDPCEEEPRVRHPCAVSQFCRQRGFLWRIGKKTSKPRSILMHTVICGSTWCDLPRSSKWIGPCFTCFYNTPYCEGTLWCSCRCRNGLEDHGCVSYLKEFCRQFGTVRFRFCTNEAQLEAAMLRTLHNVTLLLTHVMNMWSGSTPSQRRDRSPLLSSTRR